MDEPVFPGRCCAQGDCWSVASLLGVCHRCYDEPQMPIPRMNIAFCGGCPLNAMFDAMSEVAGSERNIYGIRCERGSVE